MNSRSELFRRNYQQYSKQTNKQSNSHSNCITSQVTVFVSLIYFQECNCYYHLYFAMKLYDSVWPNSFTANTWCPSVGTVTLHCTTLHQLLANLTRMGFLKTVLLKRANPTPPAAFRKQHPALRPPAFSHKWLTPSASGIHLSVRLFIHSSINPFSTAAFLLHSGCRG